jgi:hypothetical protein
MVQQIKLRLPPAIRAQIEEAAKRNETSLNAEVVRRLQESLTRDTVLGSQEMAHLSFALAASFAFNTQGKAWATDPLAYRDGASAVIGTLIRGVPAGENRRMAVNGIISSLLTLLANDPDARPQEQPKRAEEAA